MLHGTAIGGGTFLGNLSYPGDFSTFSTPAPPADNHNDGDGYTNIEEYLHYLASAPKENVKAVEKAWIELD